MLESEQCKDMENNGTTHVNPLKESSPNNAFTCSFPASLPAFKNTMDFSPSMVLPPPPVALPAETGRSFAASPTSSATGGKELTGVLSLGEGDTDKEDVECSDKCGKIYFTILKTNGDGVGDLFLYQIRCLLVFHIFTLHCKSL